MRSRRLIHFVASLSLGGAVGCLGPRQSEYVTSRAVTIDNDSTKTSAFWEGIQNALHNRGFKLDRVDERAGVITTLPVTSQQFFEVWRHDVNTREDFWEATLNPIRRWVEVNVSRDEDGTWNNIAVIVHKQRYSAPDRQFNSTGALTQYFAASLPTTTGETTVGAERDRWLDIGRDGAMEAYLLTRILEATGASVSSASGGNTP